MYFLGFSINNLTLLALTLAIGIVVDDAIIVLENAYRHQEELTEVARAGGARSARGRSPSRSSPPPSRWSRSSRRSRSCKGSTGRLFNEFGIAVAGLGDHLGLRGADAHADALRQDPSGASAARTALPGCWRTGLQGHSARATARHASAPPSGTRVRWCVAGRDCHWWLGAVLVFTPAQARVRAARGPRAVFQVSIIAPEGSTLAYTDEYQRQAERDHARHARDLDSSTAWSAGAIR